MPILPTIETKPTAALPTGWNQPGTFGQAMPAGRSNAQGTAPSSGASEARRSYEFVTQCLKQWRPGVQSSPMQFLGGLATGGDAGPEQGMAMLMA